ncbi:hypothetical protein Lser_V15G45737 [Lactuca serriola]
MAKSTNPLAIIIVFLFVFFLVLRIDTVVGTKETNKVCERRSKTWSGFCGDSKHCDQQCREWEGAKHGSCHRDTFI